MVFKCSAHPCGETCEYSQSIRSKKKKRAETEQVTGSSLHQVGEAESRSGCSLEH